MSDVGTPVLLTQAAVGQAQKKKPNPVVEKLEKEVERLEKQDAINRTFIRETENPRLTGFGKTAKGPGLTFDEGRLGELKKLPPANGSEGVVTNLEDLARRIITHFNDKVITNIPEENRSIPTPKAPPEGKETGSKENPVELQKDWFKGYSSANANIQDMVNNAKLDDAIKAKVKTALTNIENTNKAKQPIPKSALQVLDILTAMAGQDGADESVINLSEQFQLLTRGMDENVASYAIPNDGKITPMIVLPVGHENRYGAPERTILDDGLGAVKELQYMHYKDPFDGQTKVGIFFEVEETVTDGDGKKTVESNGVFIPAGSHASIHELKSTGTNPTTLKKTYKANSVQLIPQAPRKLTDG